MLKLNRLIAAGSAAAALAAAGPVAAATAAQSPTAATNPASDIPCYPLPAFCTPNGQPASWAPAWASLALGFAPSGQQITVAPPTTSVPPITFAPPALPEIRVAPLR
jgi:hypothetical protein